MWIVKRSFACGRHRSAFLSWWSFFYNDFHIAKRTATNLTVSKFIKSLTQFYGKTGDSWTFDNENWEKLNWKPKHADFKFEKQISKNIFLRFSSKAQNK